MSMNKNKGKELSQDNEQYPELDISDEKWNEFMDWVNKH
jgi:hypothetical protein